MSGPLISLRRRRRMCGVTRMARLLTSYSLVVALSAVKPGNSLEARIAAHGIRFLARQVAHHQRTGAIHQMDIRGVAAIGKHRQPVETGALKRLNFEVEL